MDVNCFPTRRIRKVKAPGELADFILETIARAELAWETLLPHLHRNYGKPPLWDGPSQEIYEAAGTWGRPLHQYSAIEHTLLKDGFGVESKGILRQVRRWIARGQHILESSGYLNALPDLPDDWVLSEPVPPALLDRKFQRWCVDGRSLRALLGKASLPVTPSPPPVVLAGRDDPVIVRNKSLPPITHKEYDAIASLLRRYPHGCSQKQFQNAGVDYPSKVLFRLEKKPGWKGVISRPGGSGHGGYRLVV